MDEYEKENSKGWQTDSKGQPLQEDSDRIEGPKGFAQGPVSGFAVFKSNLMNGANSSGWNKTTPRQTAGRAHLHYERDSPAKASWRKHQPCTDYYQLDGDLAEIAGRLSHGVTKGASGIPGRLWARLEQIGRRTGSYIVLNFNENKLLIWGSAKQASDAKRELQGLLLRSMKAADKIAADRKMPNVPNESDKQKRLQHERMLREIKKQTFRQEPEDGSEFSVWGFCSWPFEEARPEEYLGDSLEALDPIRMFCECYITFQRPPSAFKILSNEPKAITDAAEQIKIVICEYAARSSDPIERIFVEPPPLTKIRKEVEIAEFPSSTQASAPGTKYLVPILAGGTLSQRELAEWNGERSRLARINEAQMKRDFLRCISHMRFFRGRVRMRASLGEFIVNRIRTSGAKCMSFEDFLHMTADSSTKGSLTRRFESESQIDTLMSRIYHSDEIFETCSGRSVGIENVAPIYAATFWLAFPDIGRVELQVEMSRNPGSGDYEPCYKYWTKPQKSPAVSVLPLQFLNARFQRDATWRLDLSATNSIDPSRITASMMDFASNIGCLISNDEVRLGRSGRLVFKFPNTLSTSGFFEQKIAWRYQLKSHVSYVLEIARYDKFGDPMKAMKGAGSLPEHTTWGLTVYNPEWDSILGENVNLKIGRSATWDPEIETFFPKNYRTRSSGQDRGFGDFLESLRSVISFLDEI